MKERKKVEGKEGVKERKKERRKESKRDMCTKFARGILWMKVGGFFCIEDMFYNFLHTGNRRWSSFGWGHQKSKGWSNTCNIFI